MSQAAFRIFLTICLTVDLVAPREALSSTVNDANAFVERSAGKALFLTPYIENGRIEEGRIASRVGPFLNHSVVSYSGFLTVNKKWNSNLFFWFFLSEKNAKTAPLLLWLQGGPGASTMESLFLENGPYELQANGQLTRRNYRWTREYNVLYVDQPVGAGFSFTQHERGYVTSQRDVVRDLYPALVQFFRLFPQYSRNDFYLIGSSYAGKFVSSLAYAIRERNSDAVPPVRINLKGLIIGNGLIDPENMLRYGDYLYQLGFVDAKTLTVIRELEDATRRYIRSRKYAKALLCIRNISTVAKALPPNALLDYTSVKTSANNNLVTKLFESNELRKLIHVGDYKYDRMDPSVALHLSEDVMQSVASLFAELLKHYKILHYSGQLDVIIAYPLTRNVFENLHFDNVDDYYANDLKVWFDDSGVQAGHWKTAGNLTDLLVRKSGHMPPRDQPKWIFEMVTKFIGGKFV